MTSRVAWYLTAAVALVAAVATGVAVTSNPVPCVVAGLVGELALTSGWLRRREEYSNRVTSRWDVFGGLVIAGVFSVIAVAVWPTSRVAAVAWIVSALGAVASTYLLAQEVE